MEWWGWLILLVVNIPVFVWWGSLIFSTWEDFVDCVRFWLTPDLFSLFRGEWAEDWFAEFKLFVWAALCASCVFGEWWLLKTYVI